MSLAEEVRNGEVGYLDLDQFVALDESTPVNETLKLMRGLDRTTALITREGRLTGIFTERDMLQRVLLRPVRLEAPIRELMTPNPVVVTPDVTILGALRLMTEGRFRDLPVVDRAGKVLGNLTDNAIVQYLCDHLPAEVLNLSPNPNQVPKTAEGA